MIDRSFTWANRGERVTAIAGYYAYNYNYNILVTVILRHTASSCNCTAI